jgi:hypothetical protein
MLLLQVKPPAQIAALEGTMRALALPRLAPVCPVLLVIIRICQLLRPALSALQAHIKTRLEVRYVLIVIRVSITAVLEQHHLAPVLTVEQAHIRLPLRLRVQTAP